MKQKNKIKKLNFLYYLINERCILWNTYIDSVKYSHVKRKYIINRNIKKE